VVIGSEFVDNIMMSPKYWNLPKPGLIISITGNAADFKPDQALSADDVPYVMFSLKQPQFDGKEPEGGRTQGERVPARMIFVPVRKSDCLSDVLFRLSDFSACRGAAAASKDTRILVNSRILRSFGEVVSKSADSGKPDYAIKELEFKPEGEDFPNFVITPKSQSLSVTDSVALTLTFAEVRASLQQDAPFVFGKELIKLIKETKLKDPHVSLITFSSSYNAGDVDVEIVGKLPALNVASSITITDLKNNASEKIGISEDQRIFIVKDEDAELGHLSLENLSQYISKLQHKELSKDIPLSENVGCFVKGTVMRGFVIFSEKESLFKKFLKSLKPLSTIHVTVRDAQGFSANGPKFNLFQVVKAIESDQVFGDSVFESPTRDAISLRMQLPVFEDDTFADLRRKIENMSLEIEIAKDSGELKYPTLPQPFWQASTLILYHETSGGKKETKLLQESQFDDLKKLSEAEFQMKNIEFFLLRTQGSGCHLDDKVIDRILHEVAFLLPLRFGSIWIIDGGSRMGIMKVTISSPLV
jgi:hypothetical protein